MSDVTTRLIPTVETYFAALHRVRASGGATGERSHYTALDNLLTAVGAPLKPKVFCVPELADQGAGHPDFGLYAAYERIKSVFPLGLPFAPTAVNAEWFEWPALPDLFPVSFPGVKTSRDGFLVDVDLVRLNARVAEYFDEALSQEDIARRYPSVMKTTVRFDARTVRETLLAWGGPNETGFMRFAYRPFDSRWIYWETETKLLDEKRADYRPHVFAENLWLEAREREAKEDLSRGTFVRHLADNFGNGLSNFFPAWLRNDGSIENNTIDTRRPNLPTRTTLSQPPQRQRRRPVPPRPRRAARSKLPRRQRRGVTHGMATHPAAWLARW